jgi:hypothetical protein
VSEIAGGGRRTPAAKGRQLARSAAVTLADRGESSMSAISPKWSPSASVVTTTSRPSGERMETDTRPLTMT